MFRCSMDERRVQKKFRIGGDVSLHIYREDVKEMMSK